MASSKRSQAADLPALLTWRNVSVHRDEVVALDSIDLEIRKGEHVAILGPNGSGKSTLIKSITRELYPRHQPPTSEMLVNGQQFWNVWDLRSWMGMVTNDIVLTCTQPYPVEETILSGFHSSIGIWPYHPVTRKMRARAKELMELLEITHLKDRLMTELSSGEARRAVVGRALAANPQALLLDEPTNSLDITAARELQRATRRLAQSGVTIILVTHHLPDIIPEIDRVVCLRKGRIFLDGPKEKVLTATNLTKLFETPVQVSRHAGYYHMW